MWTIARSPATEDAEYVYDPQDRLVEVKRDACQFIDVYLQHLSSAVYSCNNEYSCAETVPGLIYLHPEVASVNQHWLCGCLKGQLFHEVLHIYLGDSGFDPKHENDGIWTQEQKCFPCSGEGAK